MDNFKNKKVLIMGLGINGGGVGATKFFARNKANVLVTDLKTEKFLENSLKQLKKFKNIKYALGRHRIADFKNSDLIIKNPAVPNNSQFIKIAQKNKIPIDTDIGLFFQLCSSKKIIGITGTKGKSTTATLIYHFLKKAGYKVILGGNIGKSVLEILPKIKEDTIVVLELSSFNLEGLKQHKISPPIALITNIFPDHLNRYKNFKKYIEAKKIIFKFQNKNDWLILNKNDSIVKNLKKETKSKILFFSSKIRKIFQKTNTVIHPVNLNAATTIAQKIFKIKNKVIQKALLDFKGLKGRMEFIKKWKGVKIYNDTTATNPGATLNNLSLFPKQKLILICGGENKNLNFKQLAKAIIRKVALLILIPGSATEQLKKEFKKIKPTYQFIETLNLKSAILKAKKNAQNMDVILFSPAAASFNQFKNEFDRGKKFESLIKKYFK